MKFYIQLIIKNLKNFNNQNRFFIPRSPNYINIFKNREFLIFGNGPSLNNHKVELIKLIKKKNLITMGGNNISAYYDVDYLGFTNRKRFSRYSNNVHNKTKLLLSPYFKKSFIKNYIGNNKSYDEIMYIKNNLPKDELIEKNIILFNCRTITLTLMLVAYIMGAKKIFLAGLDGYFFENDKLISETNFYGNDLDYAFEKGEKFKLNFYKNLTDKTKTTLDVFDKYFNKKGKHNYFKIITPTRYYKYYDDNEIK